MDPNFRRGVILLCDHQHDGSFGFILNKPINMNINDLISSFPDFESEVYYGGPVQTDTIHYLHTRGDLLPNSVQVLSGVYWGGDFEQLKELVQRGEIRSDDIRFYVGYTGWSAGQLRDEQEVASWMTATGRQNWIFGTQPQLWKDVLQEQGGTYSIIAGMKHIVLNWSCITPTHPLSLDLGPLPTLLFDRPNIAIKVCS